MIFMFNTVYPMINRSSQAMVSMAEKIDDRMKSRVSIVHAANTTDRRTVYVWVKNIGSSRIVSIEDSDLFFGQKGNFYRITYGGAGYPRWSYALESGTEWGTGNTIKITIVYNSDPGAATYFAKFIVPNGILDEYYFSM